MADKSANTAKGSDESILYLVTYLLTWLTGILIFITAGQKNKRLKFHAVQAIIVGIIIFILGWIPFIGWLIAVVLWLYGMYVGYQAGYQGKDILMPVIGDFAKKYS
jgi:uncharacterized membrane protein